MRYLLWPDDVIRPRLLSPFDECRRTFGYGPCTDSTGQQNKYELIPTVKMETRHPMKGYFGNEFPSSVITADLWQNSHKTWKIFAFIFGKTTPYGKIFKILFWKDSAPHWSTCRIQISWNLDDRKSVKLCYLPDKKNSAWLFHCCYCAFRPQNLPRPAPSIVFRPNWFTFGSYTSTCEHHQNGP